MIQSLNHRIKMLLMGVLMMSALPGYAAPVDELKAAYILNFAKLTTWPDDLFNSPSDPLVFCGFAPDPVMDALRALGERNVDGRPVRVKTLKVAKDNKGCHVVYFGRSLSLAREAPSLQRRGLLLIGDVDGFVEQGGIINYFLQSGKLRFEINADNARSADLVLSARLLNLAKRREEGL